jgi:hypothetical protein
MCLNMPSMTFVNNTIFKILQVLYFKTWHIFWHQADGIKYHMDWSNGANVISQNPQINRVKLASQFTPHSTLPSFFYLHPLPNIIYYSVLFSIPEFISIHVLNSYTFLVSITPHYKLPQIQGLTHTHTHTHTYIYILLVSWLVTYLVS